MLSYSIANVESIVNRTHVQESKVCANFKRLKGNSGLIISAANGDRERLVVVLVNKASCVTCTQRAC